MSLLYVELSSANTLRQVLVLAQQRHLGRQEEDRSVNVSRRPLGTQGNTLVCEAPSKRVGPGGAQAGNSLETSQVLL